MNEADLIEAGKRIISYDPLLGSLTVILMGAIVSLIVWIRAILKEKSEAQMAHLEDVRKFAAESEVNRQIVSANTEQIRHTGEAVTKLMDQARSNAEMLSRLAETIRERIRA